MGINPFELFGVSAFMDSTLSTDAWHILKIIHLENQQSLQLQVDYSCQVPPSYAPKGFVPQSFHHTFVEENFIRPSTSFICINQISGQVLQFVFLHHVWLTWE
jgi:hypothetical protein